MDEKHKHSENKAAASLKKVFGGKKPSSGQTSVSISGGGSSGSSTRSFGSSSSYTCFRNLDSASRQNAISLAEQNVRSAEERLRRTKQNLQAARDLKFRTASNVDRISTNKSIRDISTSNSERLIDFAMNSEAIAERSLIVAEQHVARAEEELQNAKNMLQAAKRN